MLAFRLCFVPLVQLFSLVHLHAAAHAQDAESSSAIEQLRAFLVESTDDAPELQSAAFSGVALSKSQAAEAKRMLVAARTSRLLKSRKAEMEAKEIAIGKLKMPFAYTVYGDAADGQRSLYISMHGGGNAPKRVNDGQWENQKRLYRPEEGVYVAPRAPTNTWNLWHEKHIDEFFGRLIENMVLFEGVDWNRVYIMGYSAGGDGVYQLAPRMADRWAAASMMAGHPNETKPQGLRNVPIALQVGGRDSAYNRNKIVGQWKEQLAKLHDDDPSGYEHFVKIYPSKGHWMDREDAVALPWMAKYSRNPLPKRIVWMQDDVTHEQFYWLRVPMAKARSLVTADVDGQKIVVESEDIDSIVCLLDDRFIDLDSELTIESAGKTVFQGKVTRTIAALAKTLAAKGDPNYCFPAAVPAQLP
jgi:predicted esterase